MKLLRKEEWKNSGVYVFAKTYTVCTVNSTTLLVLTTVESLRLVILLIPSYSILVCVQCQGLKDVPREVRLAIERSSWTPYSSEQREDVLYDFDTVRHTVVESAHCALNKSGGGETRCTKIRSPTVSHSDHGLGYEGPPNKIS